MCIRDSANSLLNSDFKVGTGQNAREYFTHGPCRLAAISPALAAYGRTALAGAGAAGTSSDACVHVPGMHGEVDGREAAAVELLGAAPHARVFGSKQRPVMVTLRGSDEAEHARIVKAGEDLRMDARVQQLLPFVGGHADAASLRRSLEHFHAQVCGSLVELNGLFKAPWAARLWAPLLAILDFARPYREYPQCVTVALQPRRHVPRAVLLGTAIGLVPVLVHESVRTLLALEEGQARHGIGRARFPGGTTTRVASWWLGWLGLGLGIEATARAVRGGRGVW